MSDGRNNHHNFFENIEKILDGVDPKLKENFTINSEIKESLIKTLCVPLYLKFKEKYPDIEDDDSFITEIMKKGFLDKKL